ARGLLIVEKSACASVAVLKNDASEPTEAGFMSKSSPKTSAVPPCSVIPEHALKRRSNSLSVASSVCADPCHPIGKSASVRTIARARAPSVSVVFEGEGDGDGDVVADGGGVDCVAVGELLLHPLKASRTATAAPAVLIARMCGSS